MVHSTSNSHVYIELERLRKENQELKAQLSTCTSIHTLNSAEPLMETIDMRNKTSHISPHISTRISPESIKTPISEHEEYSYPIVHDKSINADHERKARLSGVAAYKIVVETGLAGHLPSCVQFGTKHKPTVVFAVLDAESGIKCWSFAKSYGQLRSFDVNIRKILTPITKGGNYKLYNLPPKEMFASLEPWKVDVRNDMLNAYFSVIADLKLLENYNNATEIQKSVEQSLAALWFHDILDKNAHSEVLTNKEEKNNLKDIKGCLLLHNYAKNEWSCRYCFLSGAYMNIIGEHKGKPSCDTIFLKKATVREIVVFFDTTVHDARYVFQIRESNGKVHYFIAENNHVRKLWIKHLVLRMIAIDANYVSLENTKNEYKRLLPPYIICGTHPAGNNVNAALGVNRLTSEKSPHLFMSRSPSQSSIESAGSSSCHSHYSVYDELNNEDDSINSQGQLYDGDEFYMQISNLEPTVHPPIKDNQNIQPLRTSPMKTNSHLANNGTQPYAPPHPAITISKPKKVHVNTKEDTQLPVPINNVLTKPAIFGIPPQNCVFLLPVFNGMDVPSVIARCYQCIIQPESLIEKGIFRIPGSVKLVHDIQEKFDNFGDLNLVKTHVDVHTSADLMKRYLRMLPRNYFGDWSESISKKALELEEKSRIKYIQSRLDIQHKMSKNILFTVLRLLCKIVEHRDENQMSIKNLGIALSPAMAIPTPILETLIIHERELV